MHELHPRKPRAPWSEKDVGDVGPRIVILPFSREGAPNHPKPTPPPDLLQTKITPREAIYYPDNIQ